MSKDFNPQDIVDNVFRGSKNYKLKCKNEKQKVYSTLIKENQITICSGPAGVGKSFTAIAKAVSLLRNKETPFHKIILTAPMVVNGEKFGHLPGDIREKMGPYIQPALDTLEKIVGKETLIQMEQHHILEIRPLELLRGSSIDNTIFLVEEAQNTTPNQMKTFLTRIGYNSKFIISGDLEQTDLKDGKFENGLFDAMNLLKDLNDIGIYEFIVESNEDIVRNPLIGDILKRYNK